MPLMVVVSCGIIEMAQCMNCGWFTYPVKEVERPFSIRGIVTEGIAFL